MTTTRSVTLPEFLTDEQIAAASALHGAHGMGAVGMIQAQLIEPNMATINQKLGQENDARYLAYAVVHALSTSRADPLGDRYNIKVTLHGKRALIQLDRTQPRCWGWAAEEKNATRFSLEEARAWIKQHWEREISRHALIEIVLVSE